MTLVKYFYTDLLVSSTTISTYLVNKIKTQQLVVLCGSLRNKRGACNLQQSEHYGCQTPVQILQRQLHVRFVKILLISRAFTNFKPSSGPLLEFVRGFTIPVYDLTLGRFDKSDCAVQTSTLHPRLLQAGTRNCHAKQPETTAVALRLSTICQPCLYSRLK